MHFSRRPDRHAPRCYRHGRPIHAQRRGFSLIDGRSHYRWDCPVCGARFYRPL